jgi:hypothetical protein
MMGKCELKSIKKVGKLRTPPSKGLGTLETFQIGNWNIVNISTNINNI